MSDKKIHKKLLLRDLSKSPRDSFDALVKSFNKRWCAICWGEDFSVIGKIFIDNDCVKIMSEDNEITFIRVGVIQCITPLNNLEQDNADKNYFESLFKSSWGI